jgi:EPSP synthase (3-phosphoshikimate 1-carboxyvinyltransferase)
MVVAIETYHDHRIAMSFGVLGSRLPGLRILDPGCVAKTYPNYWRDWQRARDVPRGDAGHHTGLLTSGHAFTRHRP